METFIPPVTLPELLAVSPGGREGLEELMLQQGIT